MKKKNRELLQLAHTYDPEKHRPGGMFLSEKLDGMRAFWDGGITRGLESAEVPWANTKKDHINLDVKIATGLWSRYAKPIQAPAWFLDQLPNFPLDGELYIDRQMFQTVVSTVKKLNPIDAEWKHIKYMAFDVPIPSKVFEDGRVNNPNYQKELVGCYQWAIGRKLVIPNCLDHASAYSFLTTYVKETEHVKVLPQKLLPFSTAEAIKMIEDELDAIMEVGGEGLILKNRNMIWTPTRNNSILKVKKLQDAEGTVIGYTSGKETDKGSKLLGLMGAIVLNYDYKRLELSGFTDAERDFGDSKATEWAYNSPGSIMPPWVNHTQFPIGSKVTFRYRELTNDGLPKEARYWRK